jgi:hypothetical protein
MDRYRIVNETIQSGSPHDLVRLIPVSALGGAQCDVACEVCPLRAWKCREITSVYCREILEQHRRRIDSGGYEDEVSIT